MSGRFSSRLSLTPRDKNPFSGQKSFKTLVRVSKRGVFSQNFFRKRKNVSHMGNENFRKNSEKCMPDDNELETADRDSYHALRSGGSKDQGDRAGRDRAPSHWRGELEKFVGKATGTTACSSGRSVT